MGLADFERKLERGVEGVFGRVFKSGIRPVEIGRKLVREMDMARTVGVTGATVVPNHYLVELATADHEQLVEMEQLLTDELETLLREHATAERYRLPGVLTVALIANDSLRTGLVTIDAKFRQPEARETIAHLALPNGERVAIATEVISIGRQSDCTIVVTDPNVSRRHAEIRPTPDGVVAVDLGSTNGTLVNGSRITTQLLRNGDQVVCGGTVLGFESD